MQCAAVTTQVGATKVPVQLGVDPTRCNTTTTLFVVESGTPPKIPIAGETSDKPTVEPKIIAQIKRFIGYLFTVLTL